MPEAVDAGHRRDHDHVAARQQTRRRGVPQPLDVVVDRAVLLDVGVGLRDVRLGLVVVVVRDEVLNSVVRQHLSQLVGELRGQRLVRRHHQGGPLQPLDQPGRGRRLAGAGGAQQHDVALPRPDSPLQLLDGRRLITRGRVLADDLEATAGPDDVVDGAVLRVRKHGMFGSESHVHQGRTRHRHWLFPVAAPAAEVPSGSILITIHAPKHETFDLVARTNTDPKGIVRAVDVYTVEPWGLYMARPTPGRAQFHYMESWLLPSLGLRATVFHFNPGHELDQDYYLDVGRYTPGATAWHAEDHYLDLVVRTGIGVELSDVDELLTAVRHGLLTPETGEQAVQTAVSAIDGLSRHDYDLNRWLADNGMALTWR